MDITPQGDSQQSISDDQELAKALAGVLPDMPEPVVPETTDHIESTAVVSPSEPVSSLPQPTPFVAPSPDPTESPIVSSDLEGIKKDALIELRPLIDKVDLPAQEKFDTYLMLIRSTDDSSLIAPAYTAAQSITDETHRAEALLDVIKEIDYLSRNNQQPKI
jgi:hypothetical protein